MSAGTKISIGKNQKRGPTHIDPAVLAKNPRFSFILDAVRALGEGNARQVRETLPTAMRSPINDVGTKLSQLRAAGMLAVRRTDMKSVDPLSYNLYRCVDK